MATSLDNKGVYVNAEIVLASVLNVGNTAVYAGI